MNARLFLILAVALLGACGDDTSSENTTVGTSESGSDNATDGSADPSDNTTANPAENPPPSDGTVTDVAGGWMGTDEWSPFCIQLSQVDTTVDTTFCYFLGDTDQVTCEAGTSGSIDGQALSLGFFGYAGTLTLSDDGQSMAGMLLNDDKCDPEGCEFAFERMTGACDEQALSPPE